MGILLVIDGVTFGIAQRIDKHHPALMAEHGVETLRPQIEAPRLYRMRRVVTLEGADLRILGGEICRQQVVGFQSKGDLPPIGQRQGQLTRPGLQPGKIVERHLGHPKLIGPHLITLLRSRSGGYRTPLAGHQAG